MIEYVKNLIDQQHAWHSRIPDLAVDDYTRTIRRMYLYDSIVVLDKARVSRPLEERTGTQSFS